jgi:hypothetical protein
MKHSNVLLLAIVNTMTFCFALYGLSQDGYPMYEYLFLLIFSAGAIASTFFMGETHADE